MMSISNTLSALGYDLLSFATPSYVNIRVQKPDDGGGGGGCTGGSCDAGCTNGCSSCSPGCNNGGISG